MQHNDIVEQITALADNEIKDEKEIARIKSILARNVNLNIEYQVQSQIKKLINSRIGLVPVPYNLQRRISSQLQGEILKTSSQSFFQFPSISIFRKPQFVLAVSLVLIGILYLLFPFQGINYSEIIKRQNGSSNMFVQAIQNYQNLIDGKLGIQFANNDPDKIKKYFIDQGVKYETFVPVFNDWELHGCVVSIFNSEKLAHHIYKCKSGKLIYVFQVDEDCIKKEKMLALSDDLIKIMDDGKYCACVVENRSILIWKNKLNINIAISEVELNNLKNNFIAEAFK
ncbi:MAG: hypothetical protein NTX22_13925 [Ignavibacteriales bacterium]|nr:hypothetical protein [Ignavibacteriales bacterium]